MNKNKKTKGENTAFPPEGYREVSQAELRSESAAKDTVPSAPDIVSHTLSQLKVSAGLTKATNKMLSDATVENEEKVSSVVLEPKDLQNSSGVRKCVLVGPNNKPIAVQG